MVSCINLWERICKNLSIQYREEIYQLNSNRHIGDPKTLVKHAAYWSVRDEPEMISSGPMALALNQRPLAMHASVVSTQDEVPEEWLSELQTSKPFPTFSPSLLILRESFGGYPTAYTGWSIFPRTNDIFFTFFRFIICFLVNFWL